MLVLTRKAQQQITIGDQVTITVLGVKGNTVRIGIEAPQAVRVMRREVLDRIALEEQEQNTPVVASVETVVSSPSMTVVMPRAASRVAAPGTGANARFDYPTKLAPSTRHVAGAHRTAPVASSSSTMRTTERRGPIAYRVAALRTTSGD